MDRLHIFLWALVAGVAIRIVMHFVDKNRIQNEIESKGGRVVSIRWTPFAHGWFFEKNERHYEVTYMDGSGGTETATCKTSLFTGIYWAEGPRLEEPKPRFMPRHSCSGCGFALKAEWRACPNCGKATELA
jgi:hypothetical protein